MSYTVFFVCFVRSSVAISQIEGHDPSDGVLRSVPSTAVSSEFRAISAKALQRYFGNSPLKKKIERKKSCTYYACVMLREVCLGTSRGFSLKDRVSQHIAQ